MPVWFKVDVHLPSNPKMKRASRAAGHWAPMAYMALLAINKMHSFRGVVPADYGAPEELAEWWRIEGPEGTHEIRDGLRGCRDANLVEFNANSITISGWGPEWDRKESDAERSKRYRDRKKAERGRGLTGEGRDASQPGTPSPPSRDGHSVTTEPIEERRGEENRGEESTPMVPLGEPAPESVENVEKPPTPPKPKPKPKPKRRTEAEKLVAKWAEESGELWDLQEMLRASVMPKSRPLKADQVRLARVCKLLEDGASLEDCQAVLRSYAAEVRRSPDSGKYFNGETNWRKANFDRALGGVGAETPATTTTGRAKPMARDAVTVTGEQKLK